MRPIVSWLIFIVALAIPTGPLVVLGLRTASNEEVTMRVALVDARLSSAAAIRRDVELATLRSSEFLRALPDDASLSSITAGFSKASAVHPFAEPFIIDSTSGTLLLPPPSPQRRATVEALLFDDVAKSFVYGSKGHDDEKIRFMRSGGTIITVRRFKAIDVGFLVDEVSLSRGVEPLLAPNVKLERKSEADAVKSFLATMNPTTKIDLRAFTKSSPSYGPLGILPPARTVDTQAEVIFAPKLVYAVVSKDPAQDERDIKWSVWRIRVLSLGGVAVMIALAMTLFVRARRAQHLANLRTDFVAAVSHELRTPLASVRMLAELLEAGSIPSNERVEVEQTLAGETRRLHATLERMLRFGALARGKLAVEKNPVLLAPILTEAAQRLMTAHPAQQVSVSVDPQLVANVDAGLLGLALDNLLNNAAKYAAGSGPFQLVARPLGKDVAIDVVDRGPGMAANAAKRVFLPFERVDNRLSKATEGTGVGLALVRGIARAHGGDASVVSKLGAGSTFTLRVPQKG